MEITFGLLFVVLEFDLACFIIKIAGHHATFIPNIVTLFGQNGMFDMIEQRKYRFLVFPQIRVQNAFAVRKPAIELVMN